MTRLENFAPGPLPVINAVCEEVGLVEVIDEIVDWDETQAEISPGSLTAGLVMNFLTEGEPMYRLSEFFENKDPQNLFGDDITTEDLYDQRFGWALDKIADAEPRNVLNSVIANAVTTEGVDIGVVHADTTSKSVHGEYEQDGQQDDLNIAKGYSRDGDRQLKQFNIGLGVNSRGIPVTGDIFDGNGADTTWNKELISEIRQCLPTDESIVYVADSKAVTGENLARASCQNLPLISRLPGNYAAVDELIDRAWEDDNWEDIGSVAAREDAVSHDIQSYTQTISGQQLRCVVVKPSTIDGRSEKRIDKELDTTEEDLEDAVEELSTRVFACERDAKQELKTWLNDHQEECFEVEAEVVETEQKKSRDKPGRPPKDWEPYETVYKIAASVQRDAAAITTYKQRESCYVLVTSIEDAEEWPPKRVLKEYKQQITVEQSFPVVKDPKRVGAVYLKDHQRLEALGYVLIMALLVYSLIERRARLALMDADEPMELSGGPSTYRPTGRRVLQRFENMLVSRVDGKRVLPENVEVPRRVLELLDLSVEVYGVDEAQ
ncbi:IS1634 family transposase [Halonotius pteroides]|uniref:IS1634 family transposase n=1 Tax=Halonotius pteroides TaxID=268735 RepID=A0A3A6QKL9_9EURY|nr:IS1634 family transposase [Halonotius pteroides]RJX47993.1 IS1634 family transposase [Halonotius pteroides]